MPQEVQIGLYSAGIVLTIAVLLLVFGDRPELAAAIRRLLAGRPHIMPSGDDQHLPFDLQTNQSVDQSIPTSLNVQTSSARPSGLASPKSALAPDMDAGQTDMDAPRISQYLTDNEFIILLAVQKRRNGKWRSSANDIVKFVGGDRTEVLAIVRQVRESPAAFPPLTDEQQRLRHQMHLDQP